MAENTPVIPQTITVHLGRPEQKAENVTVPFVDYIKNVASSEIYPTWPESSLRANIYAIISFALNRIYTEWYPSRGYDFDITSSTAFDQAFVKNRDIFENISRIVDEIFNDYVAREGEVQPYFTQFCNGTTVTCDGLSQWGTVDLARAGLTPYQILQSYYGNDINIIKNAPVRDVSESYPGIPLKYGDAGNDVVTVQRELDRIAVNYPAIPRIPEINGVYSVETERAVREFQNIFDLSETGTVNKETWYALKRYYSAVKRLGELVGEGLSYADVQTPYENELSLGSQGLSVYEVQYYLNVIAYFNPSLNLLPLDGIYGAETKNAVEVFQNIYGIEETGVVDRETWNKIREIYTRILNENEDVIRGRYAAPYPGYALSLGSEGDDVRNLQTYLSLISQNISAIPSISIDGSFGPQTENAVRTFQELYGITPSGVVGATTWSAIASQYDALVNEL